MKAIKNNGIVLEKINKLKITIYFDLDHIKTITPVIKSTAKKKIASK